MVIFRRRGERGVVIFRRRKRRGERGMVIFRRRRWREEREKRNGDL